MLGKIIYMSDNMAHVQIDAGVKVATNLINFYVVLEDEHHKIVGEIEDISENIIKVHFLGELLPNKFVSGVLQKPSFSAKVRMITKEEMNLLVGTESDGNLYIGLSPLYNYPVYVNINDLFSNHMAIFGNTGSGKSYGVARLLQNVFANSTVRPVLSNFFIFDAYGEYHNAFRGIDQINPNYHFKYYTTNIHDKGGTILRIPLWLLGVDDMALLLAAETHSQLTIIEKVLKLVAIFAESDEQAIRYKNHIIAKAIMTILYTSQTSPAKRDDIFSIIATCSTPQFNLEAEVQGIGYVRKFRDCFIIDKEGQFTESILVTNYISSFIDESLDTYEASNQKFYSLNDMERALNFTLISEGLLRNDKLYNEAITLKVRLHALAIGENARYFSYPNYCTVEQYISSLVAFQNGTKAQIVNFNLEDIDDSIAKVITKIMTRMLFEFVKRLPDRASIPFHIFLEEAHRYVQNDSDQYLLGYNIFERVAKEGRKYGLIFNLISQRPVELSDTVISQCTNFMIFKMNHPRDLEYIQKMLPNINAEIVEKQKSLQPGTCVAFGRAFRVPMIIKMDLPTPEPYSSNCDVMNRWKA